MSCVHLKVIHSVDGETMDTVREGERERHQLNEIYERVTRIDYSHSPTELLSPTAGKQTTAEQVEEMLESGNAQIFTEGVSEGVFIIHTVLIVLPVSSHRL